VLGEMRLLVHGGEQSVRESLRKAAFPKMLEVLRQLLFGGRNGPDRSGPCTVKYILLLLCLIWQKNRWLLRTSSISTWRIACCLLYDSF
jgi:hypothetical protein